MYEQFSVFFSQYWIGLPLLQWWVLLCILFVHFLINMNVLSGLSSTWTYFSQIASLSSTPISSFSSSGWSSLVSLIMWLLNNPFFYVVIGIIVIMSVLPTFED